MMECHCFSRDRHQAPFLPQCKPRSTDRLSISLIHPPSLFMRDNKNPGAVLRALFFLQVLTRFYFLISGPSVLLGIFQNFLVFNDDLCGLDKVLAGDRIQPLA